MPRSLSSCDGGELAELLSRAGAAGAAPRAPTRAPSVASFTAPAAPALSLMERVAAVKEPGQRALGAALETLLGDLSRVLLTDLFVADEDGLLLAGSGDAPALAASVAADALRSLDESGRFTATQVDALLLRAAPHNFLVFSHHGQGKRFVVGARVGEEVSLAALRTAIDRILTTLSLRTHHA